MKNTNCGIRDTWNYPVSFFLRIRLWFGMFKLNDWRESDLRKIAEICGCSYEGHFKFNNGDIV